MSHNLASKICVFDVGFYVFDAFSAISHNLAFFNLLARGEKIFRDDCLFVIVITRLFLDATQQGHIFSAVSAISHNLAFEIALKMCF